MSGIRAEPTLSMRGLPDQQPEGFSLQWLALLSWEQLYADGEIDHYRVHVPGCSPTWLIARCSARLVESGFRRIEHEFSIAPRLDPGWALMPLAVLHTPDGPLLVANDPGGKSLHEVADGSLSISLFLRLAIGAAHALSQAHGNGLLHRDIKPSNFIQGDDGFVRLTGFGVTVERQPGGPHSVSDSICGTLAYMSPEQARRVDRQADERSDLYSLGMTFYEWLTGQLPFEASDAVEWVYCHVARQPPSPRQFRDSIPMPLAQLILKLIAKNPADRYQTAFRLEMDLRECLAQWSEFQHIAAFEPALQRDLPQGNERRGLIARCEELQALHAVFSRVSHTSSCEMVLLSGSSGTGKTTLVRQLQQDLALNRVLFASGKFDQAQYNAPYASLAQALRSLIMRVVGESGDELERWREQLLAALGGHGRLIANLVPEIELILGPQAPLADLPANDTQNLFNLVLHRFLNSFASPQRPLILFFDDLQWLDDATLAFIASFSAGHYRSILLIGAYRDVEVQQMPMFSDFLAALRESPTRLTEIRVSTLCLDDVCQWVGQALECEPAASMLLARVIHAKTSGNPFFIGQLLRTLFDEQLIVMDRTKASWTWNLDAIDSHRCADNVIDLMVARMARLPSQTRTLLGQMACIGSSVDIQTLARISSTVEKSLRRHLAIAVQAGLLTESRHGFAFYHDRVQESAYRLTPPAMRPAEHARIARILLADLHGEGRTDQIFEIASHLQRVRPDEPDAAEVELFSDLLLRAARQAMKAAAIQSALGYLATVRSLTRLQRWQQHAAISYEAGLLQAQCLILDAQFEPASRVLAELLEHIDSVVQRAAIYMLKVELQVLSSCYREAITTALEGLRMFGIQIAPQTDREEIEQRYQLLLQTLGNRSIASLIDLPVMQDASFEAAVGMLASMIAPASFTDQDVLFVVACEMAELSLDYGICAASASGFAWFGVVLAQRQGLYQEGAQYAQLAHELVKRHGYDGAESMVLVALDQVSVWTQPLSHCLGYARTAFASSHTAGNLSMSCYACNHIVSDLLVMGEYLERVQEEVDNGLEFSRRARFRDVEAVLQTQARFVAALRVGPVARLAPSAPQDCAGRDSAMTPVAFWWWLFEGISNYLYRDFTGATHCLAKAEALAWSTPAHVHLLELHFFSALNLASGRDRTLDSARILAAMAPHLDKLNQWAALNPQVFRDKALLVEAEMARVAGDTLNALDLYELSITAAANAGFVHVQALAHELAAEFHHTRGLFTSARSHMRSARDCYQRWGAHGKVANLEARAGFLREQASVSRPSISISGGQDTLDLVSVMKASQALSEEIVLDRLIGTLLTNTIIHAGAQQALLLLVKQDQPQISARGRAQDSGIEIDLTVSVPSAQHLPLSLLYTVMRTRQSVVLDDAMQASDFVDDPYFHQRQARSVLCLPLVKQGQVIGVLYLENNLAPGVFTSNRTTVLELLAGQAAISLETARLYAELVEENTRRRAIESALRTSQASLALGQRIGHSGSFRWHAGRDESVWSDQLFAVWGLSVAATPPSLHELERLVHPEDLSAFSAMLSRAVRTSSAFQHEFRLVMPDGSIRHLELLGEPDSDDKDVFVGVASDITERRTTEAALRHARAELATVSQATIMGELAASIAHEINQPLASIITNASASVRWLKRESPVVAEALAGLGDIVNDSKRAADIVRALQSLARQTPSTRQPLQINEVIRRVVQLTASEIEHRQVLLIRQSSGPQLSIEGDAVQLQQVILNLIMNAMEAMSDVHDGPRHLSISCDTVGSDYVVVSVQDNGAGINEENLERVFDAFYTTKEKGMGMGLAICKSIIESHDGGLYAFAGRGRGTVFVFTLPV
ncbi:trifunctional serine/threonine-protein kinase/ATP-binding protein/sensor histidine kinase [Pseudomonas syringae]|nr:AAA family ATPase [Pseudomonas syringae]